ncbi:MAG TPA: SDR family NAD(P)-dependent oxidoreductase [Candidatus Binataceae bacterium]|nr:SDR family NAD(P)-dependent oxidoreductase [Candidatus Binataceae bacterium]
MADSGSERSRPTLDARAAGARRFRDKVVIVAGAGQGIGRASARRFGEEGATVMVADIVEDSARRVAAELEQAGVRAATFVGDLCELKDCQALMARAKEVFGRIDVLAVIVGGTIWAQPFQYYTPAQIEAEVRRSFWAPMWLCWSVLPYMIEQRGGAIVNLATSAVVSRYRVPYAAAKGGVIALSTSLSKEVARYGIRVNVVAPHGTDSDDRVIPRDYGVNVAASTLPPAEAEERDRFFGGKGVFGVGDSVRQEVPMGRKAEAAEQAAAIAFLASDDASYITGQVLPVAGGATFPF